MISVSSAGDISMGDILTVQPFSNTVDLVELQVNCKKLFNYGTKTVSSVFLLLSSASDVEIFINLNYFVKFYKMSTVVEPVEKSTHSNSLKNSR